MQGARLTNRRGCSRLNLLWLCVNDIIYGLAVGSLLRDHHAVVVAATEDLVRVRTSWDERILARK